MPDWLNYTLSDFLLFSPRTYYRLFELYNGAIWPLQVVALGLAAAIVQMSLAGGPRRARAIAAILAAAWLWVAWAYLYQRYDTINWAARYFAIGFAVEALLLFLRGTILGRLQFDPAADAVARCGAGLLLFATIVQPLIGLIVGRPWSQLEVFGIAPDPTAVATLGVLLTVPGRVPWELLALPLLWCAISGAMLWTMGSPDALVMPAAGVVALALATRKMLRSKPARP